MNPTISIPKGRIRCPWMAVPLPGERPVILFTETVRRALAGVTITDAAVTTANHPRYEKGVRALEVTFTHGSHNHGRTVFYDRCQSTSEQMMLRVSIREWTEKQRERIAKKITGNGSARAQKIAQQIRRLEKEKKALHLNVPVHPLLPSNGRYDGSWLRESEWRWHEEKPERKQLARIAGMVLRSKITTVTGYKMLREAGFDFVKFSEQQIHRGKRAAEYQADYWKHLPGFVRGMSRLSRPKDYRYKDEDGNEESCFAAHAKARLEYLGKKRQAESIDAQIVSLRELAA